MAQTVRLRGVRVDKGRYLVQFTAKEGMEFPSDDAVRDYVAAAQLDEDMIEPMRRLLIYLRRRLGAGVTGTALLFDPDAADGVILKRVP
jgi:hypothetical protein